MQTESMASLKGHFLMAMPSLRDPNFSETVTCICEHTAEGAVGVVINRLHAAINAGDIFEELGIACRAEASDIPVYWGGPVRMDEIFILHGQPSDWAGSLVVTADVALNNSLDVLQAIAAGRGPRPSLLCIGCAGWGPGQLEAEIGENAWLTCRIFRDVMFDLPVEERWNAAVRKMGIDPALLCDAAGHA